MTKVYCSIDERYVDPLFEVFDGGDFILSSYHDIEEKTTQVQIYFQESSQTDDAVKALSDALSVVGLDAKVEVAEIPDEDWKLSYRRHFKTEHVSKRIYTRPPWEDMPSTNDGEIVLTLDPGLAFGTGKHETTKACLRYIDELSDKYKDATFLDMGCGSGILSIAAAKLGFKNVSGFDIDEDAVAASKENALVNNVKVDYKLFALGKGAVTLDESIEAAKGLYPDLALQKTGEKNDQELPSPFKSADVVVANILGPLLIAFADEISSYVKSSLVVSGILEELYPEVLDAFTKRGFKEVSHQTLGEWTTGLLIRE